MRVRLLAEAWLASSARRRYASTSVLLQLPTSHLEQTEPLPGLRAWTAPEPVALWEALEAEAGARLPPPFWAHAWPGSLALARVLASRRLHGVHLLDFGCGGGLAGIVAAKQGARVEASELDPLALAATRLNAEANGVRVELREGDLIGADDGWGVVLVGDVFYEAPLAARLTPWLDGLAKRGAEVLVGDPGRQFLPRSKVEPLATFTGSGDPAWDSVTDRPAAVWTWRRP